MAGLDEAEIAWLAGTALGAVERDEALPPAAVVLLLRRYLMTGDEPVARALGTALARALDAFEHDELPEDAAARAERWRSTGTRAEWLMAFLTGSSLSDDDRLRNAAATLAAELRREWPLTGEVSPGLRAVEACLHATMVLGERESPIQAAIDELERIIGLAYEPGAGIARSIRPMDADDGRLVDVVSAASALLTAYELTQRLPYAMLAEELVQFARRTWWDEGRGCFGGKDEEFDMFVANSEAARVLFRIAALHDDPEYRAHAVIAPGARYGDLATRVLDALKSSSRQYGLGSSLYGLAIMDNPA
jgi:hypothetical protein